MNTVPSIKKQWRSMIQSILKSGTSFGDRRTRVCIEKLNQTYVFTPESFATIREPVQFLSTFPDWIYPDIDEIKQIILEPNQSPHYEYSYANRLFAFNGNIDQVNTRIIPLLKKNPHTRRAILGFLNPATDQNPGFIEKPSIISIQLLYRNQQLTLTAHIRSMDVFFGFPANLIQLHSILTVICEKTNLSPGKITLFCASAHIFEDQKPYINKLIKSK